MLLETGDPQSSLEQYQVVLAGSPNRLNALLGAAKAAAGTGDVALEKEYREVIRVQTRSGDPGRSGLAQAL